jgi:hypothetical protein
MNQELISDCKAKFDDIQESLFFKLKQEKQLNTFMVKLNRAQEAPIYSMDLRSLLAKEESAQRADVDKFEAFGEEMAEECSYSRGFLNFMLVPDLILRKKMSREEFAKIVKFVNKIRVMYLQDKLAAEKAKEEAKSGLSDGS